MSCNYEQTEYDYYNYNSTVVRQWKERRRLPSSVEVPLTKFDMQNLLVEILFTKKIFQTTLVQQEVCRKKGLGEGEYEMKY